MFVACLFLGHLCCSFTGVTVGVTGVKGAMAPKSVKDKRWRDALNKLTEAIKKLLMKPDVPEDAPEDSKYMDVGAYLLQKYPTQAEQEAYYLDLVQHLNGLGGSHPTFLVASPPPHHFSAHPSPHLPSHPPRCFLGIVGGRG